MRAARVPQRSDRQIAAADAGDGVLHRDGGESDALQFADRGNSDDAFAGWTRPPAPSANVARRMALSAVSFAVQPALVVPVSRSGTFSRGDRGVCVAASSAANDRWNYI